MGGQKKVEIDYNTNHDIYMLKISLTDIVHLESFGIHTISQLCELTEPELYEILNKKYRRLAVELKIKHIKNALNDVKLTLKGDNDYKVVHYAEYIYDEFNITESHEAKIKRRRRKYVPEDKDAIGFRFFDRAQITYDGETLYGEKKNYSTTYIFGKIMTAVECAIRYKNDSSMNLDCLKGLDRGEVVIVCDNGDIIIENVKSYELVAKKVKNNIEKVYTVSKNT
jgi:hypothetical protein